MSDAIKTKIVGVTFMNEDGVNRQELLSELSAGDSLSLKDTSSNKYPEAIGVFNSFGDQLGNLKKDLAKKLREMDGNFELFHVTVLEVTGGDDRSYGCNIEISPDDFFSCLLTVKNDGGLIVETVIVDTPSALSSVPSINDTVSLADLPDSIAVLSNSGEVIGKLPPFAYEHIRERNISLDIQAGHILDMRIDNDGDRHFRILLDTIKNPEPEKVQSAPINTVAETTKPATPTKTENKSAPDLDSASPIKEAQPTPNSTPSNKNSKWILGIFVIAAFILLAYFMK